VASDQWRVASGEWREETAMRTMLPSARIEAILAMKN
jgi:hypothetical protein